jgi:membrane-associated phospholipid phosphatase
MRRSMVAARPSLLSIPPQAAACRVRRRAFAARDRRRQVLPAGICAKSAPIERRCRSRRRVHGQRSPGLREQVSRACCESTSFDNALLMFVHHYATPQLDHAMLFFSLIGSALILVPVNLLVFGVFVWLRQWAAALFWLFAAGGAALLNLLAKHSFARIRPSLWLSLAPEHTYSFRSGHAMESMAVFTACLVLSWRTPWRWPVLVLGSLFVLLVSASRVYLGVHYPTDIAAAWVASAAWVIGLVVLFEGRLGQKRIVSNVSLRRGTGQALDR